MSERVWMAIPNALQRPLYKVSRDPLTLAPGKETSRCEHSRMTYWSYENRLPGPIELGGGLKNLLC